MQAFENIEKLAGSFLTHTQTLDKQGKEFVEPWEVFCLSGSNSHIFDLPDSIYSTSFFYGFPYYEEIEGNQIDTQYAIELYFVPGNCYFSTATNEFKLHALTSYPTISQDIVNVGLPEGVGYSDMRIANMIGQEQKCTVSVSETKLELDISDLPSGMYNGVVNSRYLFRFLKL